MTTTRRWMLKQMGAAVGAAITVGCASRANGPARSAQASPGGPKAQPARKDDKPRERSLTVEEQTWLRHGFTDKQRDDIRAAFRWGIENKFVPGGSLLLVHRGETVLREGFGVADMKTGRPFAVDAPCRIASVTKPHTSTMMAMLMERGKFAWDDPIDKVLPIFTGVTVRGKGPASRVPRIRELLSHTAGFPGKRALESGQWKIKTDGTLAQAVEDLPRQGLAAEPGTVFAYTSMGYMAAGRIAEIVTGKEYGALMEETLLRPIGATTATFRPSEELKAKMPVPYDHTPSGLVPMDLSTRREASGTLLNPAGSLISTVDDVGRFLLLHRNRGVVDGKRLVAAESLQTLYKPWKAAGGPGYGMGFNIMKTGPNGVGVRIRHTGASGTLAQLDFENDFFIVLLTQVPQLRTAPFRERLLKAILSVFAPNDRPAPESPDREGE